MTVTVATANHLPAILDLIQKRIEWMDEKGLYQWNKTDYMGVYPPEYFLKLIQKKEVFIACEGEKAVGVMALFSEDPRWEKAGSAFYVHHLATALEQPGVGKEMLAFAEDYALEQNKDYLRLDCQQVNLPLNRYYEALGYVHCGMCIDGEYVGNLMEKKPGSKEQALKKLDLRLQAVADFVPQKAKLADIGTDHASLPVYLVQKGTVPFAIAADVNKGPLEHAAKAVEEAGLKTQITLRLSNGLDEIKETEADCIVMAGMGGILISQLIEKAPWLKQRGKTLILQPMTDAPLLREFLAKEGYEILAEKGVVHKTHAYTVMKVIYRGTSFVPQPIDQYVGKLINNLGEGERGFLKKEANSLQKQIAGLTMMGQTQEVPKLEEVLKQLLSLTEETI